MSEEEGKEVGGAEVADICARLTARGDELSLEAVSYIRGAYLAYAELCDVQVQQHQEVTELGQELMQLNDLWSRVPIGVREVAATMPLQKCELSQEKPHDPPLPD